MGYFLYGAYLKKYPAQKIQSNDYLLFFSPIVVGILGTYLFQKMYLEGASQTFLQLANYLQSYLGITVMIASLYLFKVLVFMKSWQKVQEKYRTAIVFISKNTFGIYLVHMIFLEYFLFRTPLTIDNGPFNPAVMIVLIWLSLVIVSFVTSLLLGVIPVVKMSVGNAERG
jgi:surface polysaccharide O-acyltransferase-like enzyme